MIAKVKIIKAKLDTYWYSGKIGEIFEIEYDEKNIAYNNFRVLDDTNSGYFIDGEDFKIISIDGKHVKPQPPIKEIPTICALFKQTAGIAYFDFFAWWREPPTVKELLSITDINITVIGELLDGNVVKDIFGNKYLFNFNLTEGLLE